MYLANEIKRKRWTLTDNVGFVVLTHGQSFIIKCFLSKKTKKELGISEINVNYYY